MSTFIIAEVGVNHNGDESLAMDLVESAAKCGADAVKFQTFSADRLVIPGTDKAEYQKAGTDDVDQHAMLRALELSDALHRKLFEHCGRVHIEFMSTPFDAEATALLLDLGVKRIKVASGELTNEPFLEYLASTGMPLIVSTGMATLEEILRATEVIEDVRKRLGYAAPLSEIVTILHCTSNYPANVADVNLRAMQTIAQKTGLPVGYSDHTLGVAVSTAAVAMGAIVIEKHFTRDRSLPGPDHRASLIPEEFAMLVRQIRDVEAALGSSVKKPTVSELPVRALVRRSVTTTRPLKRGHIISHKDVALMRPGTGIAPGELASVVGKTASRDVAAGTTLKWSDVR